MIGFKLEAKTTPKRYQNWKFQTLKDTMSTPTSLPYKNPRTLPYGPSHLICWSKASRSVCVPRFLVCFNGRLNNFPADGNVIANCLRNFSHWNA